MTTEQNTVEKRLSSSFAIDKPKLNRIVNIIEDKTSSPISQYDVTLKNGKNISLTTVDDLFSLDNSVTNPITSFSIEAKGNEEVSSLACTLTYDNSAGRNISIKVASENAKQANQLFAEIEEQVERTLLRGWIYKFIRHGFFEFLGIGIAIILLSFLIAAWISPDSEKPELKLTREYPAPLEK